MTQRLVVHENPEGRQTPVLLLAELRGIDPEIELVYFGGNDWRLGAVRPTPERAKGGRAILAQQDTFEVAHQHLNVKNVMLAKLLLQGFAQIVKFRDLGDVAGDVIVDDDGSKERTTVVEYFRRVQWNAEHARDATFKAALAESGGLSRKLASEARARDAMNDSRYHFRREMRGKSTFGYGGQTGGRGKLIMTPGDYAPSGPILHGRAAADAILAMQHELGAQLGY